MAIDFQQIYERIKEIGKSVQERTIALIAIAHPKFRPQLVKEAIETKYLSPDMAGYEGKVVIGPQRFRTTRLLEDGTQIHFRVQLGQ